jgi:hypothetical protein
MRAKIAEYLGGGGRYYRYRNGTKLLMPEQQQWIRNLFKRYGYLQVIALPPFCGPAFCENRHYDK